MLTEMDSSDNRSGYRPFGTHGITVDNEDALCVVLRGVISPADAKVIRSAMFEHGRLYGPYSFVADVMEMTGISGGARKEFVHIGEPYPFHHCLIVGASFGIRTIIEGVYLAGRVLRPSHFKWSMVMVATHDEALAHIDRYKRQKELS